MNKTDELVKDFANFIANAVDTNVEVVKIDVSDFINTLHTHRFKQMIINSNKILYNIKNTSNIDIQEKIECLSLILICAAFVDSNDIKLLTQEEARKYFNVISRANAELNITTHNIQNNIKSIIREAFNPKKEEEDLTKLSKEELIERLRIK